MENGSAGSVATANSMNITRARSVIARSHPTRRRDDNTPMTWVELASDNDHNNDDNDDDALSSVLLQVRHAYILPPATSAHVSQFTKRLESYGGVTTDRACSSGTQPLGCGRSLHQTFADGDELTAQCRAIVGDYRDTFELSHDRILQETFMDVPKIKDSSTSSGIPQASSTALQFLLLLKEGGSASLSTWQEQIPNRITTESLVRRFDHHVAGEDLEGVQVPPGLARPMSMYIPPTSGFTQPGGRPTTARPGDVSSTRQYSIMGHANEKKNPPRTCPTAVTLFYAGAPMLIEQFYPEAFHNASNQ